MYRIIIRPLLFLLKPETVHQLIVSLLKVLLRIPGMPYLFSKSFQVRHSKLNREFLGLKFDHPVGLAAGFDKDAEAYNELSHLGFSFIEIGTVTPLPQPGNPKPRSFRIPKDKGLINRMGFNNKGVDYAVSQLKRNNPKIIIGGNIGKNTNTSNHKAIEDYKTTFIKLYDHVDYLVINLSCPNIKNLNELQDKNATKKIISALEEIRKEKSKRKPLLLKISPDLKTKDLDDVIDIFFETAIDGIIATNTSISRENLSTPDKKIKKIGSGGISGKPITLKSTDIIHYLSERTGHQIPIISVGGVMSPDDAIEKLEAGADLVQVYTGFIYNGPAFVRMINKAILKHTNQQSGND